MKTLKMANIEQHGNSNLQLYFAVHFNLESQHQQHLSKEQQMYHPFALHTMGKG